MPRAMMQALQDSLFATSLACSSRVAHSAHNPATEKSDLSKMPNWGLNAVCVSIASAYRRGSVCPCVSRRTPRREVMALRWRVFTLRHSSLKSILARTSSEASFLALIKSHKTYLREWLSRELEIFGRRKTNLSR